MNELRFENWIDIEHVEINVSVDGIADEDLNDVINRNYADQDQSTAELSRKYAELESEFEDAVTIVRYFLEYRDPRHDPPGWPFENYLVVIGQRITTIESYVRSAQDVQEYLSERYLSREQLDRDFLAQLRRQLVFIRYARQDIEIVEKEIKAVYIRIMLNNVADDFNAIGWPE